jgi:glycosyltransferase involved in cell wall biosynthesis
MENFELEKKKDRMLMRLEMSKLTQHLGKSPWNLLSNDAYRNCSDPTVSVVITLYNYSEYIHECLDSVCASELGSLPNGIEITIVDDCSNDDSAQLVEDYLAQSSVPIVLVKKVFNTGLASSRNIGLDLARAPYVFILDADNWIYPQCLAVHYEAIHYSEAVAVYATINRFNTKTGESVGRMSNREWNVSNLVGSPYIDAMAMFDRNILRKMGGYSMELMEIGWSGWEDYDLWLKLAQAGFLLQIYSTNVEFLPRSSSVYG